MEVLTLLMMRFFAHSRECKYQDPGSYYIDEKDSDSSEMEDTSSKSDRQSSFQLSGRIQQRCDRTAWGSYMEIAPPMLPSNAFVPGFENETLQIAIGLHDEFNINSLEDEDDAGQTDASSDMEDVDEKQVAVHARNRNRRLPRISNILESLPTLYHVNSLFGCRSNSRSTTTTKEDKSVPKTRATSNMASRTHVWISLWFLITAPVIFWDVGYCFMRPRSFKGGDLHWIWKPYEIYQEVDYVYGVDAYNRGDGFTNAQSFLNVVETLLNIYYLYAQHLLASPSAPLIGFAAAVMTLSKTVLYWAQEYFCGGCAVGHNDMWTLFWFWILPNGLWLLVPSLVIMRLGKDITAGLTTANKVYTAKKQ